MILFIGDKPSPKMKSGAPAFQGAACEKRLMEWIYKIIVNDADKNKYRAPVEAYLIANKNDEELLIWARASKVIALGNNAAKHIFSMDIPHFKLPHPSGRNRQINDKEFIAKKLKECREWLKEKK